MDDVEPLEPALWFEALNKLARRARMTSSDQLESMLRHGYHLLQLAPRQFRGAMRTQLEEASLENLLAEAEFQVAAEALVGPFAEYSLVELADDLFEARLILHGQAIPRSVQASAPAVALLCAWLQCLISLEDSPTRPQSENPHQGPRKSRPGPHLRLIER